MPTKDRAFRAGRKAAGLCCRCTEPIRRGGRCAAHYAEALADNRERARRHRAAGTTKKRPYVRKAGRKPRIVLTGAPPLSLRGWHVYTLSDPRTGAVRYAGLTEQPRRRWYLHTSKGKRAADGAVGPWFSAPVIQWLAELAAAGLRPVMTILMPAPDEQAGLALETQTIRRLIAEGADLLNVKCREEPEAQICARCGEEGHSNRACSIPGQTVAESCEKRRSRLAAQGLCIWCAEPADPGRSRCAACREKGRAQSRVRAAKEREDRIANGAGVNRCRGCGDIGHNLRTCPARTRAA